MTGCHEEMTHTYGFNYESFNLYYFYLNYVNYYSLRIYTTAERWVSKIFRHSRTISPNIVIE